MEFKYDNKTAQLLIRFAKALGIQDEWGWKNELAKKLGVNGSKVLSNWVSRNRIHIPELYEAIEKYNLDKRILQDDYTEFTKTEILSHDNFELPEDQSPQPTQPHLDFDNEQLCFAEHTIEKWPELQLLSVVANKASLLNDKTLIILTLELIIQRLQERNANQEHIK